MVRDMWQQGPMGRNKTFKERWEETQELEKNTML